jgi:hypothetical protein
MSNPEPLRYDSTPPVLYDSGACWDSFLLPIEERKTMAKIALGLGKLKPEPKIQLAKDIKSGMTGNANTPNPTPSLVNIGTLISTAETKLTAVNALEEALKAARLELANALIALDAGLTQEAAYVQDVTSGDAVKIATTNMPIKRPSQPIGPLGQVMDLAVKAGVNAGELKAKWKKLRGAKSYEVQISADPFTPTTWRGVAPSSKVRTVIDGLTSGAKMWVRVRGIGKGDPGVWSDPATMIVP